MFIAKHIVGILTRNMKKGRVDSTLSTAPVVTCMKTLMMVFNFIFWVSDCCCRRRKMLIVVPLPEIDCQHWQRHDQCQMNRNVDLHLGRCFDEIRFAACQASISLTVLIYKCKIRCMCICSDSLLFQSSTSCHPCIANDPLLP